MSKAQQQLRDINLDICPYGDMEIVLTTSIIHATYRVSSHQLCLGSPVFRVMLEANGPRRHQSSSSTASDAHSSLFQLKAAKEHDPTALATVLYLLHGRVEEIPESITFDNLLEIAIICDYYDCAATIRPWDETWMAPHRCLTSKPGYESWLFIAWVFGNQDVFGEMTKYFSRIGVMVDWEFGVIVAGKVKRLDIHLPQVIIDAMADQRAKIGQEIVTICGEVYNKFEASDPINCKHGIKECDYITFVGLHKAFKSKKLYPTDAKLQAHITPNDIVEIAKGAITEVKNSLQRMSKVGGYSHSGCYGPADGLILSLQKELNGIEPLQLTSFLKKPVASSTRSRWESFLRNESTLTSHSIDGNLTFHLEVCKYGDIEIVLKTTTVHATYVVSSHQLRAASPTFCLFLGTGSGYQEQTQCRQEQTPDLGLNADNSYQGGHYQLQLKKEHDPTALFIVLLILHARVQALPKKVKFDNLVSIAAICDYYNCSAVLQPWCGMWIDSWRPCLETPGYEDWLFVSWVLREDQAFQTLTKKFSKNGIVEDNEFLIVVSEEPKNAKKLSKFIPREIIDAMIEQQYTAGNKIAKACQDLYEKYNNDTTTKCRRLSGIGQSASKTCDHLIFGVLHMRLRAANLFVDEFNFRSDTSITSLVSKLNTLCNEITSNTQNHKTCGWNHYNYCNSDINEPSKVAQAILNDWKPLRLATFGRKQAEKRVVTWNSVLTERRKVEVRPVVGPAVLLGEKKKSKK